LTVVTDVQTKISGVQNYGYEYWIYYLLDLGRCLACVSFSIRKHENLVFTQNIAKKFTNTTDIFDNNKQENPT
jgi:hypothetical protein